MKKFKFKEGDWCFCEFKLQQIKKMQDDKVREVSDGYFSLTSSDLSDRSYPIETKYKLISDEVRHWCDEFHELDNYGLNYPDIHRKLIEMWCEMCENADNHDKLQKLYDKLAKFGNAIVKKVKDLSFERIDGVRLFRR